MLKPDLVFINDENQERVKKAVNAELEKPLGLTCRSCGYLATGPHDCPGPIRDHSIPTIGGVKTDADENHRTEADQGID